MPIKVHHTYDKLHIHCFFSSGYYVLMLLVSCRLVLTYAPMISMGALNQTSDGITVDVLRDWAGEPGYKTNLTKMAASFLG